MAGSKYEHEINQITKEYVSRSADSTEIDRDLGKRLMGLFDIPKDQEISLIATGVEEKIFNIGDILKTTSQYPSVPGHSSMAPSPFPPGATFPPLFLPPMSMMYPYPPMPHPPAGYMSVGRPLGNRSKHESII